MIERRGNENVTPDSTLDHLMDRLLYLHDYLFFETVA